MLFHFCFFSRWLYWRDDTVHVSKHTIYAVLRYFPVCATYPRNSGVRCVLCWSFFLTLARLGLNIPSLSWSFMLLLLLFLMLWLLRWSSLAYTDSIHRVKTAYLMNFPAYACCSWWFALTGGEHNHRNVQRKFLNCVGHVPKYFIISLALVYAFAVWGETTKSHLFVFTYLSPPLLTWPLWTLWNAFTFVFIPLVIVIFK